MAGKEKPGTGGLTQPQRSRLSRIARAMQAAFGAERVLCGLIGPDGTVRFVGAPDPRSVPSTIVLDAHPDLATAATSGRPLAIGDGLSEALGVRRGVVLSMEGAGSGRGVCVVGLGEGSAWRDDECVARSVDHFREILGLVTRLDETTQRIVALEQSASALRALVENASDAVHITDLDGRVRTWNPTCERVFGWSAAEVIGRVLPHVDPSQRHAAIASMRRAVSAGREIDFPGHYVRKDGSKITANVVLVPLADSQGLPVGALALTKSLLADTAVDQLQEDFVSLISAELKNPLTAILGYAQLLGRPEIAEDPAKRGRTVRAMESRVQHMAGLVEDLLIASRVEHGELALDRGRTDLVGVVTETVTHFEQFHSSHAFVIDVDTKVPAAQLDQRRLEQALTNLLANAVAHAPRGDRIRVGLVKEGDAALISVTDTGPGVPEGLRDKVFERFYRGDDSPSAGPGLGLYLVKLIAEAHGGSVGIEDAAGGGATFVLRIPLESTSGAAPAAEEGQGGSS